MQINVPDAKVGIFISGGLDSALLYYFLLKSNPAQRAVIFVPPERVQLWFSERLELRYSTFTLSTGKGDAVEIGTIQADPEDAKSMFAPVKTLPPGGYVVKYRVLSTDGHVVENQFSFTIRSSSEKK